ncbi:hypothetical protein BABINDRAFT_159134 [Babjeviella inositovora NRRL Y-12698]|uniref:BHLH domain-containing protein n=1 Tax=Babjeviella inositovora NRRL Y-12698 TaxID=984486 RepID=A0A1E3QY63_9ASCO|nr:uncharacterized protein BABINDRAFT_159134 [Babjeviella inositovora NRRL Y-12698]ODQ82575.1 hypothetical protein BABINDRAFT_159134 [Babjeviella inositovora NRRL Y-12698]
MSALPPLNVAVPANESKSSTSNSSFLTAAEKKAHHIASEKKRREQIRLAFDKIVAVVPDLSSQEARSELSILTKSTNYIDSLRKENHKLLEVYKNKKGHITNEDVINRIKEKGGFLGEDLASIKDESASP